MTVSIREPTGPESSRGYPLGKDRVDDCPLRIDYFYWPGLHRRQEEPTQKLCRGYALAGTAVARGENDARRRLPSL
jgi:hypothetical protein